MPPIITYSLKADQPRSDSFYHDIATFTDEVIHAAEADLRPLVSAYQDFVQQTGRETPRSWPEYLFELLTLGVLWRIYAAKALHLPRTGQITLAALVRLRQTPLKPAVDALRGVLSTLFLARGKPADPAAIALTPEHLKRLLDWLAAAGDFGPEVERLRGWAGFLASDLPLSPHPLHGEGTTAELSLRDGAKNWAQQIYPYPPDPLSPLRRERGGASSTVGVCRRSLRFFLRYPHNGKKAVSDHGPLSIKNGEGEGGEAVFLAPILSFAAWFEARSLDVLGKYTPQVEHFLAETHPAYRWREDVVFCGRQRVEYHLNMVGTEILNRAFRADFLAAPRKVVFLPPCMRARPESECQAKPSPYGALCAGCQPDCRVHQVTQLGKKHDFAVFLLPDDLARASAGSGTQPGIAGIVGVSCPLTIISGGWNCKDQGIPAQGLLLDYCGCPWHWDKDGFPTEINLKQLLRLVAAEGETG